MTYQEWLKGARPGRCVNCNAVVPVKEFSYQGFGDVNYWCYLCSFTPSATEVTTTRPLMGAMSLLLNALKPMPKPRKPRQSKKITVEPMTPKTSWRKP